MKKFIKIIPFGIAVSLVLISIIKIKLIPNLVIDKNETVETIRYVLNDSILYASIGLLIILIFMIQRKKYWKHLFGILLIAALTPFIQFYNQTFSLRIGIISIEFISFGLLIFHLSLNKEVIIDSLEFFKKNEVEIEENREKKVERFVEKFASKKKSELEKIIEENFLVPEAIEAAKRLLEQL